MQQFHVSLISASMKLPGPFLALNDTRLLLGLSPSSTYPQWSTVLKLRRLPETSLLGEA